MKNPQNKDDLSIMITAVGLSNKAPKEIFVEPLKKDTEKKDYNGYLADLKNLLKKSNDNIIKDPIAFYKTHENESPAGYVIETNRKVIVCYHGTQAGKIVNVKEKKLGSGFWEILNDLSAHHSAMKFGEQEVNVHTGFKKEYDASNKSLIAALAEIDKNKEIHITGHSLGGAVAQIAALDLSINQGKTVTAVTTFGSPRVLSKNAAKLYLEKGLSDITLRVKQDKDPIPRLVLQYLGYTHSGYKLSLNSNVTSDGVHSGDTYRILIDKINDRDMVNIRPSSLDKPEDQEARGKTGSVKITDQKGDNYQLKKNIVAASYVKQGEVLINNMLRDGSTEITDHANMGEFISATILRAINEKQDSFEYIPEIQLRTQNDEVSIVSKYIKGEDKLQDKDGKDHDVISLMDYTGNTEKKDPIDVNSLYQGVGENANEMNDLLKKDLAMGIANSILIGDHDVNLGNFVVSKHDNKHRITRIDLGNAYNGFINTINQGDNDMRNNYALDYLNREIINQDSKGTIPKLWRDLKNITISKELAESLKELSSKKDEMKQGLAKAKEAITNLYDSCAEPQKQLLITTLKAIAKNINPKFSKSKTPDQNTIKIAFDEIEKFQEKNMNDMGELAKLISFQVKVENSLSKNIDKQEILNPLQNEYQELLKIPSLKNSKGDGIEWVNSDFKVNKNCNLEKYISDRYKYINIEGVIIHDDHIEEVLKKKEEVTVAIFNGPIITDDYTEEVKQKKEEVTVAIFNGPIITDDYTEEVNKIKTELTNNLNISNQEEEGKNQGKKKNQGEKKKSSWFGIL